MAPPQAERVMALVHVAMFDALNSIDRRYRPALVQLDRPRDGIEGSGSRRGGRRRCWPASIRQRRPRRRDALAAWLAAIPAGEAKAEGIRLGEAVAAKVLQARTNDGSEALDAYRPKARPGVYVPTAVTVGFGVAGREAVCA